MTSPREIPIRDASVAAPHRSCPTWSAEEPCAMPAIRPPPSVIDLLDHSDHAPTMATGATVKPANPLLPVRMTFSVGTGGGMLGLPTAREANTSPAGFGSERQQQRSVRPDQGGGSGDSPTAVPQASEGCRRASCSPAAEGFPFPVAAGVVRQGTRLSSGENEKARRSLGVDHFLPPAAAAWKSLTTFLWPSCWAMGRAVLPSLAFRLGSAPAGGLKWAG